MGLPSESAVKNLPAMQELQEIQCSIPGSGRSPGGQHGNPLQNSCLENINGQWSLASYSPQGHRGRHD